MRWKSWKRGGTLRSMRRVSGRLSTTSGEGKKSSAICWTLSRYQVTLDRFSELRLRDNPDLDANFEGNQQHSCVLLVRELSIDFQVPVHQTGPVESRPDLAVGPRRDPDGREVLHHRPPPLHGLPLPRLHLLRGRRGRGDRGRGFEPGTQSLKSFVT